MKDCKYTVGDYEIHYLITDDEKVSLRVLPVSATEKVLEQWNLPRGEFTTTPDYVRQWSLGQLAYFQLAEEPMWHQGVTMKNVELADTMRLVYQDVRELCSETEIVTHLKSDEGYEIEHIIRHKEGFEGLEFETEFINNSEKGVTLEMLTSFTLDNLSPYQIDDAPNKYRLHRFLGGWSLEGKHICSSIEDLALEKTWSGFNCSSEKFGSIGTYPVERYFPFAAFEDCDTGVIWAAQLAHNATWQMELTRYADTLSLSGGVGDYEFCGWKKKLGIGESFRAPKAYIAAVEGDIYDACNAVTDMQRIAYLGYGEKGLPICFNEYCTSWGKPTQEKMLSYCGNLKELGVRYAIIDAGWCKEGCEQNNNGEWKVDTGIFPDMAEMCRQMREMGIIPGIWFEFEVTTVGSVMFEPKYDYMHLKRDGNVINQKNFRTWWDFRREDVREYLREKVIEFLKKYGFGYIKVDYNGNAGISADGAESGAEGMRQHLEYVRDFFIEMKREIPDLIIENCASGGHRLEPSMLGVSALSSFSDAHEAREIPYIAANLHNLMLPAQELIWATLKENDSKQRLTYSLAATFLGRMCLSGDIDKLNAEQMKITKEAIEFYKKLDDVIINGKSRVLGNRGRNARYPTGVQIVKRMSEKQLLIVCHGFKDAEGRFELEIPDGFKYAASFGENIIKIKDDRAIVEDVEDYSAAAVLLER